MRKKRFGRKDEVVYVPKQLPENLEQPLSTENAPKVELSENKEEEKTYPSYRGSYGNRGNRGYRGYRGNRGNRGYRGNYGYNSYGYQQNYYHGGYQSHGSYAKIEEKYNQDQNVYDESKETSKYEKIIMKEKASKYKDYSKDAAAVSFYYEDFFKQFPNLNERSKEVVKGLCECTQECLICQNKIFQKSKIWNCERCAQPYHIGCIKRWIVQVNFGEQYDKNSGKSSLSKIKEQDVHWSCPNCNTPFNGKCPRYKCFCGRRECPEFSPYILPHSCGKPCDRQRHPWCQHMTCNTLCHPGQCEPCQEQVELTCFCGKNKQMVPCSNANQKSSCGQTCGKLLSCGKHYCDAICHEKLQCNPCAVKVTTKCYCGKQEKEVICGHENFACEGICGKTLNCGEHKCTKMCHSGKCEDCELVPEKVKNCPCGKMALDLLTGDVRKKCTDPIAICGMPCGKLLPCKEHKCKNTCHMGPCAPCKELVDQTCRCGSTKRKIDCYLVNYPLEIITALGIPKSDLEFLCKKRCDCLKKCNKHRCNRFCCDVIKKYGNHIQDDPNGFHLCQIVCDKLLSCKKHRCPDFCHLGFCKPCPVISYQPLYCTCGKTMKEPPIACGEDLPFCTYQCAKILPCGHQCLSKCHPGECPPCTQLVLKKQCKCGKESYAHVTCSKTEITCGKKCDKELVCGHKCPIICHEPGKCQYSDLVKGCGQKCNKQRKFCIHRCQEMCHPGKECPNEPCSALVTVYCECKTTKQYLVCGAVDGPVTHKIPCSDECAKAKRKLAFEKFAGVKTGEEAPSNPDYYPEPMIWLAKTEPLLIQKVEKMLLDLILNENQCGVPLPDMESKKREIIVELVQNNYYLDVGAYKTAKGICYDVYYNKKARLPKILLSQMAKMEKEGTIKPVEEQPLPFEATIYVYGISKGESINDLKALLGKYIYKYYVEKKGNYGYYLHFYEKKQAEGAYEVLKAGNHTFKNFKLIRNDQEDDEEDIDEPEAKENVKKDAEGFEFA